VVLVFDDPAVRDRCRTSLIPERIYPAVLWPLEAPVIPLPEDAVLLSRRILSLHCDFRYTAEDMLRVAAVVAKVLR
jgi:hypothetical protein